MGKLPCQQDLKCIFFHFFVVVVENSHSIFHAVLCALMILRLKRFARNCPLVGSLVGETILTDCLNFNLGPSNHIVADIFIKEFLNGSTEHGINLFNSFHSLSPFNSINAIQ